MLPNFRRNQSQVAHRRSLRLHTTPLEVEALESRLLLAGTVDVSVQGGNLIVVGDAADNDVKITEASGLFTVEGRNGTSVNNGVAVAGVTGNVQINLSSGNDVLFIEDVNIIGNLLIDDSAGANRAGLVNSTVGGDVSVDAGTANVTSQYNVIGHSTTLYGNTISGQVDINHGRSTVRTTGTNLTFTATGIRTYISNNSINGGGLSVNNGATRATGYFAFGTTTIVQHNNIFGDVTVTDNNNSAVADDQATASDIRITNNSNLTGEVRVTVGNSTVRSQGQSDGLPGRRVHGVSAVVSENTFIGGDLTIETRNSRVTGDKISEAFATRVRIETNTALNGRIAVRHGNANASASYETFGHDLLASDNSVLGGLTIENGNAVVRSLGGFYGAYGSVSRVEGNDLGSGRFVDGTVSIRHGTNRVNGGFSYGSLTYLETNSIGDDVTISTGNQNVRSRYSGYGNYHNIIDNTLIEGDVVVTTSNSTAITARGEAAQANITNIEDNSTIDGDIAVTTKNARASGGAARGNLTSIVNNAVVSGDVRIQHGNANASTFYHATGQATYVIDSGIRGEVSITNGNANARTSGYYSDYAIGVLTQIESSTLDLGVTITNGSSRASGKTATGFDQHIRTSLVGDNLTISNGNSTAFGDEGAVGSKNEIATNTNISGAVSVQLGNSSARTDEGEAKGNHLLFANNGIVADGLTITLRNARVTGRAASAVGNEVDVAQLGTVSAGVAISLGNGQASTSYLGGTATGTRVVVANGSAESLGISAGSSRGSADYANGAQFQLTSLTITGNVAITERASSHVGDDGGDSNVDVLQTQVTGDFEYESNSGDNRLLVHQSTFAGQFMARTGSGEDLITILGSTFSSTVSLDGGSSTDTFEDDGGNNFNGGPPALTAIENVI